MKILISRLSAMGDVAMLIPLVYAVAQANPQHSFTLLTQPFLGNLLINPPSNLECMAIDIRREERGFFGLLRYGDRLRRERFDVFIDLHDVLRTKILRLSQLCRCTKLYHLSKPRKARKAFLSERPLRSVTPMLELYRQTLEQPGLVVPKGIPPILPPCTTRAEGLPLVGIAPFASTLSKTYELSLMEQLVFRLSERGDCELVLFGARGKEADTLQGWAERYPRVRSVAGALQLPSELQLIRTLACMVSMDSANMHLASMMGVPVVSLWCATHPLGGFLGMGQRLEDCLGAETLSCRPCSIFGKVKRCTLGDMPCRRAIEPEAIEERILYYMNKDKDKV